jgi:acyl-CoA hydrolase
MGATSLDSTIRDLTDPSEVVALITDGTDLVASMANGEPSDLLDAVEDAAYEGELSGLTVHQMHPVKTRRSMTGELLGAMDHTSYFLSGPDRGSVGSGVTYVPSNFSEVPSIIKRRANQPLVLATVAERNGRLYWSTNAEYVAALVRDGVPAIVEVGKNMPCLPSCPLPAEAVIARNYTDRAPHCANPKAASPEDERIAELVAERIPSGSTLQIGIGAVPDRVCHALASERTRLRIHSELFSDGMATLIESGATSVSATRPAVATLALGSQRLYDFMDGNPSIYLAPVDEVNAPRRIAAQPKMVSICATTEVDLYGQCASATVAGRWYSGSGGQLDFMRGVHLADDGQGFMVMRSRLKDGSSRIKASLAPGSAVTTGVHFIDKVVTEYGVAELDGRSLSERAWALISIAAPEHRDELAHQAREANLL